METNKENIKRWVNDIQEHEMLVKSIVKALSNIEYRLQKLEMLDIDYEDLPNTREYLEKIYKASIKLISNIWN